MNNFFILEALRMLNIIYINFGVDSVKNHFASQQPSILSDNFDRVYESLDLKLI
jgi:hypothetical protein